MTLLDTEELRVEAGENDTLRLHVHGGETHVARLVGVAIVANPPVHGTFQGAYIAPRLMDGGFRKGNPLS